LGTVRRAFRASLSCLVLLPQFAQAGGLDIWSWTPGFCGGAGGAGANGCGGGGGGASSPCERDIGVGPLDRVGVFFLSISKDTAVLPDQVITSGGKSPVPRAAGAVAGGGCRARRGFRRAGRGRRGFLPRPCRQPGIHLLGREAVGPCTVKAQKVRPGPGAGDPGWRRARQKTPHDGPRPPATKPATGPATAPATAPAAATGAAPGGYRLVPQAGCILLMERKNTRRRIKAGRSLYPLYRTGRPPAAPFRSLSLRRRRRRRRTPASNSRYPRPPAGRTGAEGPADSDARKALRTVPQRFLAHNDLDTSTPNEAQTWDKARG